MIQESQQRAWVVSPIPNEPLAKQQYYASTNGTTVLFVSDWRMAAPLTFALAQFKANELGGIFGRIFNVVYLGDLL